MPSLRDHAVVLRWHLLGESDRIVTLLTRNHGKVRAVAKGVRKTTSRIGARLEPLMWVDVQWSPGKSLAIVQQVELIGGYGAKLATNYDAFASAQAMVETADKLTEHEATTDQTLLLVGGLRALAEGEHPHNLIVDSYLLRALSLAGWTPSVRDCAQTGQPGPHRYFVPALGGMVSSEVAPPGSATVSPDTVDLLDALLHGDWAVAEASSEKIRNEASALVQAFVQFHLERGLRALGEVSRVRRERIEESGR
jgi:DNA repair protein RecO (recombination protein O)